jgi:hypothetical protein
MRTHKLGLALDGNQLPMALRQGANVRVEPFEILLGSHEHRRECEINPNKVQHTQTPLQ